MQATSGKEPAQITPHPICEMRIPVSDAHQSPYSSKSCWSQLLPSLLVQAVHSSVAVMPGCLDSEWLRTNPRSHHQTSSSWVTDSQGHSKICHCVPSLYLKDHSGLCASSELEVNGPSTKLNFAVNFNVEETQIVLGDSQEKELGCLFVLLSAIRIPQQCPTVLLLYELLELLQDSFNEYSKFGPIGGRGQLNWVLFSKCTRRSVPLNNAAPVLLKIIPLNIRSSRLFACPSSERDRGAFGQIQQSAPS